MKEVGRWWELLPPGRGFGRLRRGVAGIGYRRTGAELRWVVTRTGFWGVCKRVSNEILRVQDNDEDAEIPDRICSFQASN